ncbi:MCE family protein [Pseudonocardia spinosispora]|uniref:MCE family protein n=1 Tax=Pseudonocardia spinosispora TaxID=103441 RepID=UPI0004149B6B|nr:MCE family protein [Pseudonocardia spinosispora]
MKLIRGMVLAVTALALTGCQYQGINSLELPGTQGSGDGAYAVRIHMRDVTNLVPNSPVRVADVNVGHVASVELDGWAALVTVKLNPNVVLPENAVAKTGQTSLLGAKHLELGPPVDAVPVGRLHDGSVIGAASSGNYPETEDVIAAVAALLNGGGLEQVRTITVELNRALGGRETDVRAALRNLANFTQGLDKQKADIVAAIEGLNRLSAQVDAQRPVLENALDAIPPALDVLNDQREQLTHTLDTLSRFGDTANRVIDRSKGDLVGNLADLEPSLRELANSGDSLAKSLRLIPTVIFPTQTVKRIFKGDYLNLFVTVDLTLAALDQAYLSGTPAAGTLFALQNPGKNQNGTPNPATAPLAPLLPGPDTENTLPVPRAPGKPVPQEYQEKKPAPSSPALPDKNPLGGILGGTR